MPPMTTRYSPEKKLGQISSNVLSESTHSVDPTQDQVKLLWNVFKKENIISQFILGGIDV